MKFPDEFKTGWWLILLTISSLYLILRLNNLLEGSVTYFDLIILIIWIGFMLTPLYEEFDFLGLKFKQEVKQGFTKINQDLKEQILNLRTDLQNTINLKSEFNPIIINQPLSEAQLKSLEEKIPEIVTNISSSYNISRSPVSEITFSATNDALYCFKVRLEIEKEIRGILSAHGIDRKVSLGMLLRHVRISMLLPDDLLGIIIQINQICTWAIHDEIVDEKSLNFIKKSLPEVLPLLRQIRQKAESSAFIS